MNSLAASRYHRSAPAALVLLLLVLVGTLVAAFSPSSADAAVGDEFTETQVDEGFKLFAANCATCHGLDGAGTEAGPSLVGVGAASVDFQVGTGRMPAALTTEQAAATKVRFTQEEIHAMAAFVDSLGGGPAIPTDYDVDGSRGDAARGMEIFRTNCAMCHGSVGGGGALTQGKYAPALWATEDIHIYEAMLTGPSNMPIFNEANLTPEMKRDIIAYLEAQRNGSPGGLGLGAIGPVSEGLWGWLVCLGAIIAATVWIGARSS